MDGRERERDKHMTRTKLHELTELGQSVWLDYMNRSLVNSSDLRSYVTKGLRGITSNPTIFEKAIAESNLYDGQIQQLAQEGKTSQEIFEELMFEDCRRAADVLRPLYDRTEGTDGYFSLEVDPHLAHDSKGSSEAARRFFKAVNRPNLMVKIPATPEGMSAIRALTAEGNDINITLMFSIEQYEQVAEAFLAGLEERVNVFHELKQIVSVASFFVSRVDTKVDELLHKINTPESRALKGKIGIANAKMAYQRFKEIFRGERWQRLVEKGAQLQRVLYGSTGTKNPNYSDLLYVENLIGPNTVNTMPPETIEAFLDHGTVELTLERDLEEARTQLAQLEKLEINLNEVTRQLLDEGLEKFVKPFDSVIKTISEKQSKMIPT
jgi:transaldolase